MRLGANLGYQGAGRLARAAEDFGYALALAPEGLRSDAPSVLGLMAGATRRIGLGSAVMQMPARPPGLTALTAATLDALSDGRFRLGLGISNPQVADGWYGAAFTDPLSRTREYVTVVRRALTGQPVEHQGRHYNLPGTPQHRGVPLQIGTEPCGPPIPLLLAASGPRTLRLAGEIADGWLGALTPVDALPDVVRALEAGRARTGRGLTGFELLPSVPTAVANDLDAAVDLLRDHYVYLLGIGDPEANCHYRLAVDLGHARQAAQVRRHLAAADRAAAAAAVPAAFVDATALVGPVRRIAHRMRAYADAGATTLGVMVSATATDVAGRVEQLRCAAEALHLSRADG
ncbi:LLM class flavin-dependent oxidoreductase [Streptomyces sp. NPDC048419]|uniref:LLM class flavin-dependent oxidoreductase n=1 Tax=Streptomyces sp. NPDC048419 TaxID=3365547 RepID=UPI003717E98A